MRADLCGVTDFATINGSGSSICFLDALGSVGLTAVDNRLFVEAVLYRYRAGLPWRDVPERFGTWKNIHRRFSRWSKSGVWESVFRQLAIEADNEYAMIDRTIVCARQHSAGAKEKSAKTRRLDNPGAD